MTYQPRWRSTYATGHGFETLQNPPCVTRRSEPDDTGPSVPSEPRRHLGFRADVRDAHVLFVEGTIDGADENEVILPRTVDAHLRRRPYHQPYPLTWTHRLFRNKVGLAE